MKTLRLFALLIVFLYDSTVAADEPNVDASRIEVTLVPDQLRVPLEEPTYLSFIVKNNSDRDLQVTVGGDYRNNLGRPESFKVRVVDEAGDPVRQPDPGATLGGRMYPMNIPASGTYSFRLFLPHWATFDQPGKYQIHAERKLRLQQSGVDLAAPASSMDVHASASIEILPPDPERLGKLIDTQGERILERTSENDREAFKMLDAIRDERVIPWYLKALRTDRYELKFAAISALARFNNDEALNGLKEAMKTTGADIGHTATPELAEQLADQIRHAAAGGLSNSPHIEAVPFLLLHRTDRSATIRLDVVHAIANRLRPDEAIPMLESMTGDSDEQVSREAALCLKEVTSKQ